MSSELRVDKIIPTNGVPSGTYNAGGIIQMKQFFVTSNIATTSSSDTDVITGTITPHFTTSKILIMVGVTPYGGNTGTLSARGRIRRGGSSGTQIYYNRRMFFRDSGGQLKAMCGAMNIIDSPNTTSAVTYVFQTSVETSGGGSSIEFYSDGYGSSAPENSMTLVEVSA
tara:strand:- start:25 stop:531 length:507 start_codon:yes stop_codon:yes gene_type:complete